MTAFTKKFTAGVQEKFKDEFDEIHKICDDNKRYKKYCLAAHEAKKKSEMMME